MWTLPKVCCLLVVPLPSSISVSIVSTENFVNPSECWNDGISKKQCCNPLHGSKGLSSCWIGGRSFERCCEAEGIMRRKTTDASRNTSHFYHGLNSAWPFYFGQVQNYVRSLEDGDLSAFAPCSMKELYAAVSCWLHTHDATTFEVCCLTPDITSTTCSVEEICCRCFPTLRNATRLAKRVMAQYASHVHVNLRLLNLAKKMALHATSQALAVTLHFFPSNAQALSLVGIAITVSVTLKGFSYIFDPSEFECEEFHRAANGLLNGKLFDGNRWKLVADVLKTGSNSQVLNIHGSMSWQQPWRTFEHFPIMHGPSRLGKVASFLGEELEVECADWGSIYLSHECLNVFTHLRTLPLVDEEYFEWHSILQAAFDAAEEGRTLLVADVGSGLNTKWLLRAAKAFNRLTSTLPCVMLAVEIGFAINGTAIFDEAVASNLPSNRCTWIASAKELNANFGLVELLDETTISEQRWDLIDMDCDGCEVTLLSELVPLALRVRRVHLSTHSREIHQLLLGSLKAASWHIDYDFAPRSAVTSMTSVGPFLTKDGRIVAASPFQ